MRVKNPSYTVLASRYNVDFANQILHQLAYLQHSQIDLFDIMALNEVAHEMRQEIKALFSLYHAAHGRLQNIGNDNLPLRQNEILKKPFKSNHRTIMLRRQIVQLCKSYQAIKADSRILTKEYMRRLNARSYYQASQVPTEKNYRAAAYPPPLTGTPGIGVFTNHYCK
jgi:hypothetical protein